MEILNFENMILIISVMLTAAIFVPYFKDIFSKKTKPHLFTWLI